MELINCKEPFLGVQNDAKFQARSFVLCGVQTFVVDCMRRKKGFAFAVGEGCLELASEVGRVSERTSFKKSSRSVRARFVR